MLIDKNIYIQLCFGLSKLYTNIKQDQKGKLDHHKSMLFACIASGEGLRVRGLKMLCQRGSEFFLLALCACVCGGGGSCSVPLLP